MIITHNISAMNTNRQMSIVTDDMEKVSKKLSSGYRINSADDDAAGLSISEKMRAQIKGLNKGSDNIQDGMSLINVADGVLEEVHSMLQRMNELCVQAANDTNTDTDRQALQSEIDELTTEITRVGKQTTFNTMPILDDAFAKNNTPITSLVTCDAAESGYLTEAYQINGKWYAAAKLNFSNINAGNISQLNDKGFSFNCSQSCPEAFDFKFYTDGTPSSASNLSGSVCHKYVIDISQCKTGADVLDTLFKYVTDNPPQNGSSSSSTLVAGAVKVSHSNEMIKDGNSIIIYANWNAQNTESEAKKVYPRNGIKDSGAIDCTSLVKNISNDLNKFKIQCSSNPDDYLTVQTHRVNSETLKIDSLSVTSHNDASTSIKKVSDAIDTVSSYRSELGAYSNRLEHAYNNVKNTSENVQASESAIRDADMADEMVKYSRNNILQQVGNSMLVQANQSNQGVLSLLA